MEAKWKNHILGYVFDLEIYIDVCHISWYLKSVVYYFRTSLTYISISRFFLIYYIFEINVGHFVSNLSIWFCLLGFREFLKSHYRQPWGKPALLFKLTRAGRSHHQKIPFAEDQLFSHNSSFVAVVLKWGGGGGGSAPASRVKLRKFWRRNKINVNNPPAEAITIVFFTSIFWSPCNVA